MPFSIIESIKFGWEKFKHHSGLLLYAVVILVVVEVVSSVASAVLESNAPAHFGVSLILGILSFVVGAGYVVITLKLAKGEEARYSDLIPPFIILWRYLVASLAIAAMVIAVAAIGLFASFLAAPIFAGAPDFAVAAAALVIAAGVVVIIYLALRYSMAFFAVLEGERVVESFKKSTVMTKGMKWRLIGFLFAMVLVNIVGLICLVVGLLVSVPVSGVAYAHVYTKLKGSAGNTA